MYPAHKVQHNLVAHQTAKSQQAGPRRPHHHPHLQQNSDRPLAGRACALSETPRKLYSQDRTVRKNAVMEVTRTPISRRPLQEIRSNAGSQSMPRQQQAHVRRAETKVEPAQPRMSDMYMMIDDHLAWNMSSSNLESTRPGSSGTLFVDFDAAGDIEVSYRNGINKKLPTPPVPAKPTPPRREVQRKESKNTKTSTRKPLPPRPSLSLRHDSIISTGHEDDEHIDPFSSFPTPQPLTPPPKNPRRSQSQPKREHRSHPPQVHVTQRSSAPSLPHLSATPPFPNPPPKNLRRSHPPQAHITQRSAPSLPHPSTTQPQPTPPPSNGTTYTDPSGLLVHYHAPNTGANPAPHAYISGYDPVTHYAYDYDGRTVHVHASPTPSRPGSYTSEYIDVSAAECLRSSDTAKTETALPALQGPRGEPKGAKRRRVMRFVQKLLGRLEGLGVGAEVRGECRCDARVNVTDSWVEKGYVT